MSARITIPYDPHRWIPVPLDYIDSPWADAGEWATWLADEALHGRENAEELYSAVRGEALATALFPAAHVSFRFWHYPDDGQPSGFVDAYVQARRDDGTSAAELLPELGFTAVQPVVEDARAAHLRAAVRRLTLGVALPSVDAEPALHPRAEWLGYTDHWVCYLVSTDHDVAQLNSRLSDIDALFDSIDLAAMSAS
ncbi:MAG: hypothetical protein KKH75_03610 [Actinobacteria bacterium]|nr:hypothetical protein [Actinomycetota bacterium]